MSSSDFHMHKACMYSQTCMCIKINILIKRVYSHVGENIE